MPSCPPALHRGALLRLPGAAGSGGRPSAVPDHPGGLVHPLQALHGGAAAQQSCSAAGAPQLRGQRGGATTPFHGARPARGRGSTVSVALQDTPCLPQRGHLGRQLPSVHWLAPAPSAAAASPGSAPAPGLQPPRCSAPDPGSDVGPTPSSAPSQGVLTPRAPAAREVHRLQQQLQPPAAQKCQGMQRFRGTRPRESSAVLLPCKAAAAALPRRLPHAAFRPRSGLPPYPYLDSSSCLNRPSPWAMVHFRSFQASFSQFMYCSRW